MATYFFKAVVKSFAYVLTSAYSFFSRQFSCPRALISLIIDASMQPYLNSH